jgi:hypothetical protein
MAMFTCPSRPRALACLQVWILAQNPPVCTGLWGHWPPGGVPGPSGPESLLRARQDILPRCGTGTLRRPGPSRPWVGCLDKFDDLRLDRLGQPGPRLDDSL